MKGWKPQNGVRIEAECDRAIGELYILRNYAKNENLRTSMPSTTAGDGISEDTFASQYEKVTDQLQVLEQTFSDSGVSVIQGKPQRVAAH